MQRVPIHARLLKYYYASLSCRCIWEKKLLIYCLDVRVCMFISNCKWISFILKRSKFFPQLILYFYCKKIYFFLSVCFVLGSFRKFNRIKLPFHFWIIKFFKTNAVKKKRENIILIELFVIIKNKRTTETTKTPVERDEAHINQFLNQREIIISEKIVRIMKV